MFVRPTSHRRLGNGQAMLGRPYGFVENVLADDAMVRIGGQASGEKQAIEHAITPRLERAFVPVFSWFSLYSPTAWRSERGLAAEGRCLRGAALKLLALAAVSLPLPVEIAEPHGILVRPVQAEAEERETPLPPVVVAHGVSVDETAN
jgi:hypothetical protein